MLRRRRFYRSRKTEEKKTWQSRKAKKKSDPMEFALRSLTRKRQTVEEMRTKLANRYPELEIEPLILRLEELGYLDDEEFARAWIRHRNITGPKGKQGLYYELKRKGIHSEYIRKALDSFQENDAALIVARKKWKSLKNDDFYKRQQKTLRFLASRGFSYLSAKEAIKILADE